MDGDTASTSLFLVSARHDLIAGRAHTYAPEPRSVPRPLLQVTRLTKRCGDASELMGSGLPHSA